MTGLISATLLLLQLHSVLVKLLNYSVKVKLACLVTRLAPCLWSIWKQDSNANLAVVISMMVTFSFQSFLSSFIFCDALKRIVRRVGGSGTSFLKLCLLLLQAGTLCNTLLGYFAKYFHARKKQRPCIVFCHLLFHMFMTSHDFTVKRKQQNYRCRSMLNAGRFCFISIFFPF